MAVFIRVEDHGVGGAVVVLVDTIPTDEYLALGGGDQRGIQLRSVGLDKLAAQDGIAVHEGQAHLAHRRVDIRVGGVIDQPLASILLPEEQSRVIPEVLGGAVFTSDVQARLKLLWELPAVIQLMLQLMGAVS